MSFPLLIDRNNYSFNKNSKNGIYIIHGFTNSTYETNELALYLSKLGYYTVTNNLPGHGTTIEDCNNYKFTDWLSFVEKDVAEMFSNCDNVYIIGISMGSVLAIHLGSMFPVKSVVLAATVLKFKDFIGTKLLTPIFHKIVKTRHKGFSYPKRIRNRIQFYGYHSWPLSAVNEMRKLNDFVLKEINYVKVPALILQSKKDKLQHSHNTSIVYNSIASKIKEIFIVKHAGHNLFLPSKDQNLIFTKIASFIKKY